MKLWFRGLFKKKRSPYTLSLEQIDEIMRESWTSGHLLEYLKPSTILHYFKGQEYLKLIRERYGR